MDGAGRAHGDALAAELALVGIDIGDVVRDGDGLVTAGLGADAAADAGGGAGLLGRGALVLVAAVDPYAHAARALGAELDQPLRAGLGAGAAGGALGLIDHRETRFRVHAQRAELAGVHAVAAAEAAESAGGVAAVEGGLHAAGGESAVGVDRRTVGAGAVAAYDGDHRCLLFDLVTEDGGYLGHGVVAADRTEVIVQVRGLHGRFCERPATGETAPAAVRAGHHLLHLVDARILDHLELFSHQVEDEGKHESDEGDNRDCCPDCVHGSLFWFVDYFSVKMCRLLSLPLSSQSTKYQRATPPMPARPLQSSFRPVSMAPRTIPSRMTTGMA